MRLKIGIGLLLILGVAVLIYATSRGSVSERAARIRVGDSKTDVQITLGEPAAIFSPNLLRPFETYAYSLDPRPLERLWFPDFRLFGPFTNDVTVKFDALGKVVKVTIPKLTK